METTATLPTQYLKSMFVRSTIPKYSDVVVFVFQSGKCQCDPIKDCVLCQAFDQKNDKCATCEKLTIQKVDFINITEIGEDNVCGTSLANCVVNFHFAGNAKNKTIVVQKTPGIYIKTSPFDSYYLARSIYKDSEHLIKIKRAECK